MGTYVERGVWYDQTQHKIVKALLAGDNQMGLFIGMQGGWYLYILKISFTSGEIEESTIFRLTHKWMERVNKHRSPGLYKKVFQYFVNNVVTNVIQMCRRQSEEYRVKATPHDFSSYTYIRWEQEDETLAQTSPDQ